MRLSVATALLLAGCGSPVGTTTVHLAWHFADGRRCAEAGVLQVVVSSPGAASLTCASSSCAYLCYDGETAGVDVGLPSRDVELDLAANTPQGDTVYRGAVSFSGPVPPTAAVTLYFTGGG